MRDRFDRRVVSDDILDFIRACQEAVPSHLAGGIALSGGWLSHRLSRDVDLFVHDATEHRDLVRQLRNIAKGIGGETDIVRDAGGHVRARLRVGGQAIEVDVVHEALADLDEPIDIESIRVESARDLRASKLTCILSRSEPRDLVDLLFLERSGHRPELDLDDALKKDAGIDPGIMAWLLRTFPIEPLPSMLMPLGVEELREYRDALAARFKALAKPG